LEEFVLLDYTFIECVSDNYTSILDGVILQHRNPHLSKNSWLCRYKHNGAKSGRSHTWPSQCFCVKEASPFPLLQLYFLEELSHQSAITMHLVLMFS